jgi:hypothetical protein
MNKIFKIWFLALVVCGTTYCTKRKIELCRCSKCCNAIKTEDIHKFNAYVEQDILKLSCNVVIMTIFSILFGYIAYIKHYDAASVFLTGTITALIVHLLLLAFFPFLKLHLKDPISGKTYSREHYPWTLYKAFHSTVKKLKEANATADANQKKME